FANSIARDLGEDVVFVAFSDRGAWFTWGSLAVMIRAATAGLFGWDGKPEWHPYPGLHISPPPPEDDEIEVDEPGELDEVALAAFARVCGLELDVVIADVKNAVARGARAHPAWPDGVDAIADYLPERARLALYAAAVVAAQPAAANEVALERA